ncbi:Type 1 glutamine amidotransferase-like domain-containing protein [Lacimicrobium sp. SS2-24]|uniref:Type 1 glutamine amidotransferase-like domain-containing protein n=1 Tax=Lacimicrobium sp. SS2-24 TaxID=2005569 RepID=UPI000B4AD128|nr:Type 1 glutamine amidotransferase-like domain-containing protein [Lacimicrobium sp. SS2-24]
MKPMLKIAALLAVSYGFQAQACLTIESENNDSETSANGPLCSSTPLQGNISSRQDVDWYQFNLAEAGEITISLSHGSRADFDWDLYEVSGPAVLTGASSANPETGSYVADAGEHLIKVTRYSGTGDYQLLVDYPDGSSGSPACNEYGPRPSKPQGLTASLVGNAEDSCPTLPTGGAVLLMGGGTDVDDAFSLRVKPHINGGDIVVLRTTGTDAYNAYLSGLTDADSVETLIVDSVSLANSDYVEWAINSAEFVWISGGDQSDYLNQWAGTKVQAAIDAVYQRGGVIGGTSAGNAVQSEYVYDPDGVAGAISDDAVTDFCHNTINITTPFLSTPVMQDVITDTHFYERDRMGRMAVFLAHIGMGKRAIGVSEATSMFVSEDGNSIIDGQFEAYVLETDSLTQFTQTQCGQPVILRDLLRYRLVSGDTFNLSTGQSNVTPIRLDIDGRNTTYYAPSNPY